MNVSDIITRIKQERGIDTLGKGTMDLIPLNDLNVHKREVWNLSITAMPEAYFSKMNEKYKNKQAYSFQFALQNLNEGFCLCRQLSNDFGTPPCEISSEQLLNSKQNLFLVVHIHQEFSFTPATGSRTSLPTQDLVMNYLNA